MESCRILTSGWWDRSNVKVTWSDHVFQLPLALQDEADLFWQTEQDKGYFNGKMARLHSWRNLDQHLQINLEMTDYKSLLFCNQHTQRLLVEKDESVLARALGVSAVVQSNDDHIVFMKRSEQVGEYPKCYDLFGGHIDSPLQSSADIVFAAMELELEEELGLPAVDYQLHCFGLLETIDHRKPELLFCARCRLTAAELVQHARGARDAHEFDQVLILADDARAIMAFLHDHDDISPSAYGCLYLYSQLRVNHERQTQTFQG
jgi:8-oxo-dGTP pyrophosphatase MutT (NUDIX family)